MDYLDGAFAMPQDEDSMMSSSVAKNDQKHKA